MLLFEDLDWATAKRSAKQRTDIPEHHKHEPLKTSWVLGGGTGKMGETSSASIQLEADVQSEWLKGVPSQKDADRQSTISVSSIQPATSLDGKTLLSFIDGCPAPKPP